MDRWARLKPVEGQCARWARDARLDVSKKPHIWSVRVHIETHGELPRAVWSGKTPRFFFAVTSSCWFLELYYKDKRFSYGKVGGETGTSGHKTLQVATPKTLATLRSWLTGVEKKLRIEFRRDRPFIESNVKGGAQAMVRWISNDG